MKKIMKRDIILVVVFCILIVGVIAGIGVIVGMKKGDVEEKEEVEVNNISNQRDILCELGITSVTGSKLKTPVLYEKYEDNMFLEFSGNMFVSDDYREPSHGDNTPVSWYCLGGAGVSQVQRDNSAVFMEGRLTDYECDGSYMSKEKLIEFTTERYSGCLYEYEFELFTKRELEYGISRYWVAFFTEGQGKPIYVMYFNCDYFTKAEALNNIGTVIWQRGCGQVDKKDLEPVENLFGEEAYVYTAMQGVDLLYYFYDSEYEPLLLAFGEGYYLVDLNGDGKNELINNAFYSGDGGRSAIIFIKKDGKVYRGFADELLDVEYDNSGVASEYSYYIPEENVIEIGYWKDSLQSYEHKKYEIDLSKINFYEYDNHDEYKGMKIAS